LAKNIDILQLESESAAKNVQSMLITIFVVKSVNFYCQKSAETFRN